MRTSSIALFNAAATPAMEQAARQILGTGQIASGPLVERFQERIAQRIGRPHVVSTDTMTSALSLALKLAGVKSGDDVLTLAFSCMSSNAPIALAGARAVWIDIDPQTASACMDDLRRAITPRTRALTLYHMAGYPGPADVIADFCHEHGIVFIEDCNNALGATLHGTDVGRHGDYAVHSFYPNRQVNALDGGSLACPTSEAAQRASRLRRFGIDSRTFRDSRGEINPGSDIPEISGSSALSQLHAAAGLAHLDDLDARLAKIRANARILDRELAGIPGLTVVAPLKGASPVYWGFLVLLEKRDRVLSGLKARGIQASTLHQRNDTYTGFRSMTRPLPGTDDAMRRLLALPCGWWLDGDDMIAVAAAVREECEA